MSLEIYVFKKDNLYSGIIKNLPLIVLNENGKIYKWIKYNTFEKKPLIIPQNYKKLNSKIIKNINHLFINKNNKNNKTKNSKKYYLYSIGSVYNNEMVEVLKNQINIYKKDFSIFDYCKYLSDFWIKKGNKFYFNYNKLKNNKIDKSLFYTKIYKKINNYKKIIIGKDGKVNSILIQKDNTKFVLISNEIIQFNIKKDDKVVELYSKYNGNLYAEPFIIGKKNIYSPTFECIIDKNEIPKKLSKKNYNQFIISHKCNQKLQIKNL